MCVRGESRLPNRAVVRCSVRFDFRVNQPALDVGSAPLPWAGSPRLVPILCVKTKVKQPGRISFRVNCSQLCRKAVLLGHANPFNLHTILLVIGNPPTLNKSMRCFVDYCTGVKGHMEVGADITKIVKLKLTGLDSMLVTRSRCGYAINNPLQVSPDPLITPGVMLLNQSQGCLYRISKQLSRVVSPPHIGHTNPVDTSEHCACQADQFHTVG